MLRSLCQGVVALCEGGYRGGVIARIDRLAVGDVTRNGGGEFEHVALYQIVHREGGRLRAAVIGEGFARPGDFHLPACDGEVGGGILLQDVITAVIESLNGNGVSARIDCRFYFFFAKGDDNALVKVKSLYSVYGIIGHLRGAVIGEGCARFPSNACNCLGVNVYFCGSGCLGDGVVTCALACQREGYAVSAGILHLGYGLAVKRCICDQGCLIVVNRARACAHCIDVNRVAVIGEGGRRGAYAHACLAYSEGECFTCYIIDVIVVCYGQGHAVGAGIAHLLNLRAVKHYGDYHFGGYRSAA